MAAHPRISAKASPAPVHKSIEWPFQAAVQGARGERKGPEAGGHA
jgi:hypothetical protein